MKIQKYIYNLLPVLLICAGNLFCQNVNFESVQEALNKKDFEKILSELKAIDTSKVLDYDKATWLYYKADYFLKNDANARAYESVKRSKNIFEFLKENSDINDCNFLILKILRHQNDLTIGTNEIIKEISLYAEIANDTLALREKNQAIAEGFFDVGNQKETLKYFRIVQNIDRLSKDLPKIAYGYMNIGSTFQTTVPKDLDSSLFYTHKAVPILKRFNKHQNLAYCYNNLGIKYNLKKDYLRAIEYYKMADSITLEENITKSKIIFYENLSETYGNISDYKNEARYLKKLRALKDSINDTQQNIKIAGIKEQFDNEKLRADNLEIEAKRSKNQNIAIALGGGLIGVSLIGFLLFKNTKRKQRIAEQGREIEIRKTEKILKEQELTTIDAMISGQEKERQRLAGDLHDSVGATLAAAKMQFNHLKGHKESQENLDHLYTSTGELLEQAYQEIRSMAHLKNSGVIAKNGLLPAIEKLAKNASATKSLTVEVQDFGLDNRLENSLEISIFRIIQELVTNIIKHANASEASITITQHEDSLSIIIEDNGKGFDATKVQKKEGMGLSSIERRVEHLEGTMEVDSTIGIGTSILIDIPI